MNFDEAAVVGRALADRAVVVFELHGVGIRFQASSRDVAFIQTDVGDLGRGISARLSHDFVA